MLKICPLPWNERYTIWFLVSSLDISAGSFATRIFAAVKVLAMTSFNAWCLTILPLVKK